MVLTVSTLEPNSPGLESGFIADQLCDVGQVI